MIETSEPPKRCEIVDVVIFSCLDLGLGIYLLINAVYAAGLVAAMYSVYTALFLLVGFVGCFAFVRVSKRAFTAYAVGAAVLALWMGALAVVAVVFISRSDCEESGTEEGALCLGLLVGFLILNVIFYIICGVIGALTLMRRQRF